MNSLRLASTRPRGTFAALSTTAVYDLYWKFAVERQAIFFRRLRGQSAPWSDDTIFQKHKFTNAYRASDRASQFLIQKVIYNPMYSSAPSEIVFRILIFKLFNKIETWRTLETALGRLSWQSFSIGRYAKVLTREIASGHRIYSPAYIMPPVSLSSSGVKHDGHLQLVDMIMRSDFVSRVEQSRSLDEVFLLLKAFPSLGDFLAFQLTIDINYSEVIDHDEADFVVAGPGARDGLAKTFEGAVNFDAVDLIRLMMDRQESEFERLGLSFQSLWGRRLQLIDCQNLFCEISKYTRVSHPEITGVSGRTRIKQMFRPSDRPVQPWYPPKWKINAAIETFAATTPDPSLFQVLDEAF